MGGRRLLGIWIWEKQNLEKDVFWILKTKNIFVFRMTSYITVLRLTPWERKKETLAHLFQRLFLNRLRDLFSNSGFLKTLAQIKSELQSQIACFRISPVAKMASPPALLARRPARPSLSPGGSSVSQTKACRAEGQVWEWSCQSVCGSQRGSGLGYPEARSGETSYRAASHRLACEAYYKTNNPGWKQWV